MKNEKQIVKYGVLLLFLGLVTGIFSAMVMTGKISGDPQTALASHIVALMGGFLILAMAYSIPFLDLSNTAKANLAWVFVISNYANWIVTVSISLLRVKGIDYMGNAANDTIFVILNLSVVFPLLIAGGFWVFGLWKKDS